MISRGLVCRQNLSNIALCIDGGSNVNYGTLHSEIRYFVDKISKGALVFLIGNNDRACIIFYLACLESGVIPLLLAEDISLESLQKLMHAYRPNYLFKIPSGDGTEDGFSLAWQEGEYGLFQNDDFVHHEIHPDLALLLATSGSTGSVKLVRLSLKNLIENATSIAKYLKITSAETAITSLPFNYSYGLSVINSHLLMGASIVLTNRSLLDAGFWKLINEWKVTNLAGVPYSYEILLKLRLERLKMPTIKTFTQAGGRLDPIKIKKIAEFCLAKNMRFFTMYGQTEATARISYLQLDDMLQLPGSIGKAIPNGRLRLEGADGRSIETPGVVGELVYEGPNVSMGYAECLDDLKLGDIFKGVLHTGDLASFDEAGYFYIDGRIQRFLKIFGVRISLDAIERMLIEMSLEGASHGTDDLLIISVVNLQLDKCEELHGFFSRRLGLHHSGVRVQNISNLPRLANGKVDYQCLNKSA